MKHLLTLANPKTAKSISLGYLTAILHLLPARLSGRNLCPFSSAGCRAACLNTAGRGVFSTVQQARERRSHLYIDDRRTFNQILLTDIDRVDRYARERALVPVYRLGGTHEANFLDVIRSRPRLRFYDYIKSFHRARQYLAGELPANYHVTFSRSENNEEQARELLEQGLNVACVFRNELPKTYWGRPVINGDAHDLRFLDKRGSVVGLRAKGKARRDTTGFVIDL